MKSYRKSAVEVCALTAYAELEAASGATSVFPTLFAPLIIRQLKRHREETVELSQLKQVRGFRLESPYLANTGAGTQKDLQPISRETTDALLKAGGGHIKIWDISPELPRAPEEIHHLTQKGIVCSIAHTKASIDQARSAVDAGATLVTHLFDVFELPKQIEAGFVPAGLVDYLLIEDRGVRMVDRGMGLAGSALTPIDGFRSIVQRVFKAESL